ncbi:hypothetical protein COU20_03415 [Candidatus Kaiserbacteria bacterium CG10_big_fil_rev_8_21_14_0_10_59_10]|uniref:Uncharacterized protein n=1 Tax=Candidatus Kaiserbacteria bacterium CG10_big_fil_rev_8_21_14_0_10_59_10 TaxID=1974612 RepID=A0A2H0U706_9BACT|nr:MAG: hypothetical protein COU20_03415 [Candidatus Kaiserbacteria bacterium CG10_big_fil_rev_8_21_14_0_10_59_10]
MDRDNSGVNTVLIVLLIIIVVGALVWFLRGPLWGQQEERTNIDVNLPETQAPNITVPPVSPTPDN